MGSQTWSHCYRADQVDALVWQGVKSLLTDPEATGGSTGEVHREREKENAPIRERRAVVDDPLAANRS